MLSRVQNNKLRRLYAPYRGNGFKCNYCGNSFSKFAPWHARSENSEALDRNKVIAGYGENVFCPECMSTSRERLVIGMLGTMNISGKEILHLAPEEKIFNVLKRKCNVISADLMPGLYSNADKHIRYADVTMLPFTDQCFDMVIANHIMEHIPNDHKAMREIYRVLRDNGFAILQIPFSATNGFTIEDISIDDPDKQSALFGQKDHVRIYSLNDYMNRLRKAGFVVGYMPYESLGELHNYAIQPDEGFISIVKKTNE
ncbi:MAG: class I SAM-dependent methyltransferase [Chitinophagaceae bacterium]|nr:class I SAM-dependent methyltransferase [Chitinophagaceae bacterium]